MYIEIVDQLDAEKPISVTSGFWENLPPKHEYVRPYLGLLRLLYDFKPTRFDFPDDMIRTLGDFFKLLVRPTSWELSVGDDQDRVVVNFNPVDMFPQGCEEAGMAEKIVIFLLNHAWGERERTRGEAIVAKANEFIAGLVDPRT